MSERVDDLVTRLRKGGDKTLTVLSSLSDEQWQTVLYEEPSPWTVRDMLAHLLSVEEALLRLARNVAAGGPGVPEGLDYNAFNAQEQVRLAGIPPAELLAGLAAARETTAAWTAGLDEAALDRKGHHPALGEVTLETIVNVIHGHQLIHLRDLRALLRAQKP